MVSNYFFCVLDEACRSPWMLLEIDPETLRADDVLTHDGSVVGAVAAAQQVGRVVYLGAVFGDRIGAWRTAEDGTGSIWSSVAGLPLGRVLAGGAFAPSRTSDELAGAAASLERGAHQS